MNPEDAQAVAAELEVEMMADMYNKMTDACHKKCISTKYHQPDLEKGEAVCLDRCVAKYLEVHEMIGKKLTEISQGDEESLKKLQSQSTAAAVTSGQVK